MFLKMVIYTFGIVTGVAAAALVNVLSGDWWDE